MAYIMFLGNPLTCIGEVIEPCNGITKSKSSNTISYRVTLKAAHLCTLITLLLHVVKTLDFAIVIYCHYIVPAPCGNTRLQLSLLKLVYKHTSCTKRLSNTSRIDYPHLNNVQISYYTKQSNSIICFQWHQILYPLQNTFIVKKGMSKKPKCS